MRRFTFDGVTLVAVAGTWIYNMNVYFLVRLLSEVPKRCTRLCPCTVEPWVEENEESLYDFLTPLHCANKMAKYSTKSVVSWSFCSSCCSRLPPRDPLHRKSLWPSPGCRKVAADARTPGLFQPPVRIRPRLSSKTATGVTEAG